ncbi:MAG: sphingomyelin phosphodiesterase [Pirellulales bacterium]|nr:sphingomyelin phosphodiesterase [Pirellulales bacterium]
MRIPFASSCLLCGAVLVGLTLGSLPASSHAAEPERKLRVISYNVQFLPGIASIANRRKDPAYRAKTIGEKMASFDIVGLNEVFEHRPRKTLLESLEKGWDGKISSVVSPDPEDKRFNGGLAIATHYPIVASHVLTYSKGSSPKDYGLQADGFAAKGALHAQIALEGDRADSPSVDVFVTHLESKSDEIRRLQYTELAGFIREHSSPDRPTLILGDMNTRGNPSYQQDSASAYNQMIKNYGAARGENKLVDLWPHLMGEALGGTNEQESTEIGNRIDYVMFSNPTQGGLQLVPKSIQVNGYLDERVGALSDHSAVEAEFVW